MWGDGKLAGRYAAGVIARWEESNAELGAPDPGIDLDTLTDDEVWTAFSDDAEMDALAERLGLGQCTIACREHMADGILRCRHMEFIHAISYRGWKLIADGAPDAKIIPFRRPPSPPTGAP